MPNPIFSKLDKAASKALQHQNKVFKFQSDPHLLRYEQMTDADLQAIAKNYGQDALTEYVTTMESRRLKGGSNG